MTTDNGNVTMFDRFHRLIRRDIVIPPVAKPPEPTPVERATGTLSDWAQSTSDSYPALLTILDTLRQQAEMTENASLANQPLMLFHHGRVAAFKELRAYLDTLRRDAPPA